MSKMENVTKGLPEILAEHKAAIASYNEALNAGKSLEEMSRIEGEIREVESSYAAAKKNMVFASLKATENPVLEGVRLYSYEVLGHKLKREDGVVTGVEASTRDKCVDLVDLCSFCGLPTAWKYRVERMNLVLATRAAKELGYDGVRLRQMIDAWVLSDLAKREKMGETPMSNAQCVKLLQSVVDAILPEQGFKCNNWDVAFLLMSHTERDKRAKCAMKVIKGQYLYNVILDVLNRIVTGGQYNVEIPKLSKQAVTVTEQKAEEKKAEEKKTEPEQATVKAEAFAK